MTIMPKPIALKPLADHRLWVRFDDGVEGFADLSEFAGRGVFEIWNDYRHFENVHIEPDGAIAWSNEVEMCPDAIYLKITGKSPEELFPKLRELQAKVAASA